jgi:type I restriction enzyme M protein
LSDGNADVGRYFTRHPLIDAMVECVVPRSGEVVVDPACGTGGVLLAAHILLARTSRWRTPPRRVE